MKMENMNEKIHYTLFYHIEINDIIYSYMEYFLTILVEHIAVDGTYEAINSIKPHYTQLYIVASQVISSNGKTTICIPAVAAFCPNKRKWQTCWVQWKFWGSMPSPVYST